MASTRCLLLISLGNVMGASENGGTCSVRSTGSFDEFFHEMVLRRFILMEHSVACLGGRLRLRKRGSGGCMATTRMARRAVSDSGQRTQSDEHGHHRCESYLGKPGGIRQGPRSSRRCSQRTAQERRLAGAGGPRCSTSRRWERPRSRSSALELKKDHLAARWVRAQTYRDRAKSKSGSGVFSLVRPPYTTPTSRSRLLAPDRIGGL